MKNLKTLSLLVLCILLGLELSADSPHYPFSVEVSGEGEKEVILIPGLGCSGEVWDETRDRIGKGHTFHTLTMAGFAGTAAQPEASIEAWASGIAAYIRDKGMNKPTLIGHSIGGGMAMLIAAEHPDIIGEIIVVDALPALAALTDPEFKSDENIDCSAIVDQMISVSDERFYMMQKMGMNSLLANEEMRETVINWTVASDRATFANIYCDFSNTDLRDKISQIECPALILLEAPFEALDKTIQEQYKNLKKADLRYATDGLHFIMYDDKEWYLEQLNEFLIKS